MRSPRTGGIGGAQARGGGGAGLGRGLRLRFGLALPGRLDAARSKQTREGSESEPPHRSGEGKKERREGRAAQPSPPCRTSRRTPPPAHEPGRPRWERASAAFASSSASSCLARSGVTINKQSTDVRCDDRARGNSNDQAHVGLRGVVANSARASQYAWANINTTTGENNRISAALLSKYGHHDGEARRV